MGAFSSLLSVSLLQNAIVFGTVIMLGCLGETVIEKGGQLNLGLPGMMYIGAISSLIGVFYYESGTEDPKKAICLIIALACGFGASALSGLLFSFLTITLKTNQNVTGLTLTIFGGGVANFFGSVLTKSSGGVGQLSVPTTSAAFRYNLPALSEFGTFSKLFLNYGFMVYFTIILAIILQYYFDKTKIGLNLRAVGESPSTADAAGIDVTKYQYLSTCIGAGIAGLGGIYFVMDYTKGTWSNDGSIEGLGWLALALVIFTTWKPKKAIWGAYLFGLLYWAYAYISGVTRSGSELFKMLPYVVTIIVLVFTSFRNKKENQGPAHLGLSYFREDR